MHKQFFSRLGWNWHRCGTVIETAGYISNFPATVEMLSGSGNIRLWYSRMTPGGEGPGFSIGYAVSVGGAFTCHEIKTQAAPAVSGEMPVIGNLPDGWQPTQPIHLTLPNGRKRLYFWAHSPAQGIVRFLAAESRDGLHYNVLDPLRPCLYHYSDRAVPEQLTGPEGLAWGDRRTGRAVGEPEASCDRVCNDATTLYQLPDGGFELYTAAIRRIKADSPEYIAHDNASGFRRIIVRYTSADGLAWNYCGPVIEPDEKDTPEIQFYHLAVTHTTWGRLGLLGRYDAQAQTVDVERCVSRDGIVWERHDRRSLLPREAGEISIYPGASLLYSGGDWLFYYTSLNFTHNHQYCSGRAEEARIKLAVWHGTQSIFE